MSNEPNELIRKQIQSHLDNKVAGMDGQLQSRLRQARSRAIDDHLATPGKSALMTWLPAGAAMAAVILLAVLLLPLQQETSFESPDSFPAALAAEDLDILTQPEDLEFYEDLDFYSWMAAHEMG